MTPLIWATTVAVVLSAESAPAVTPYSLPFQLRPTLAASVVRSDSSFAVSEAPDGSTAGTAATFLLASYAVTPAFSPFVRAGFVHRSASGTQGDAFTNPMVGMIAVFPVMPGMRVAWTLAGAAPLGQGGGDSPSPTDAFAIRNGPPARAMLDNAMFATNDIVVLPGLGWSWQLHDFTVQLEATVFALNRVRGEQTQPDSSRTNFTSGAHVGYFIHPKLSVAAELRYQRWLSTPVAVALNPLLRDCASLALGARGHFPLEDIAVARPGLSLTRGLSGAVAANDYWIVQLDAPFIF